MELRFSNLTSFVTVLFDVKIDGVCTIHTGRPKIKAGDRYPISEILGIAS